MNKLEQCGVMALWDCDKYVAAKSLYDNGEDFIQDAIRDYDLLYDFNNSEEDAFRQLLPTLKTAYMMHRCTYHPYNDLNDWWELVEKSGRGRVPVWLIDCDEVKEK